MSRLNATKNYAKDKTIHLSKYLASFSIVFKVFEVFLGAKIRQIAVLEVASPFARRFTEILFASIFCSNAYTITLFIAIASDF